MDYKLKPERYYSKYEILRDEGMEYKGKTLYPIRALVDVTRNGSAGDVVVAKAGERGGYVEDENNLSHYGACWIYPDAKVYGGSRVDGDAQVYRSADVECCVVKDMAVVDQHSQVRDSTISDHALVGGSAIHSRVCGKARIYDVAYVEDSVIRDRAIVEDTAIVRGSQVSGNARVRGFAIVRDESYIYGDADVKDNAIVTNGRIHDNAVIKDRAEVEYSEVMASAVVKDNAKVINCAVIGFNREIGGNKIVDGLKASKEKKYVLTTEVLEQQVYGKTRTLHRIRAVKDIPKCGVKKGDLGGYIETEDNLSHEGSCWVGDDAIVCMDARVEEDAQVRGQAFVRGEAQILGEAVVEDLAQVCDSARVYELATVRNTALVGDKARVEGQAVISGDAAVFGNAVIQDMAVVKEKAMVSGQAKIGDYAVIEGYAHVTNHAFIGGNMRIGDKMQVSGNMVFDGETKQRIPAKEKKLASRREKPKGKPRT